MDRNILRKTFIICIIVLFLSTSFIPFVNANIQNENNLNIKNIDVDYITNIKNIILNKDCNCQKPIDQNSDKGLVIDFLCLALLITTIAALSPLLLFELFGSADMEILKTIVLLLAPLFFGASLPSVGLAILLDCEWTYWTDF